MSDTATMAELVARLDRFEQKDAIASLVNRYCRTADTRDWDGWAECFTPDGVYEGPFGNIVGRDALRELTATRHVNNVRMQHSITNLQVEIEGDSARGTASLIFFGAKSDSDLTVHGDRGGHYTFEFRRDDGQWRISKNRLAQVWETGEQF